MNVQSTMNEMNTLNSQWSVDFMFGLDVLGNSNQNTLIWHQLNSLLPPVYHSQQYKHAPISFYRQ